MGQCETLTQDALGDGRVEGWVHLKADTSVNEQSEEGAGYHKPQAGCVLGVGRRNGRERPSSTILQAGWKGKQAQCRTQL